MAKYLGEADVVDLTGTPFEGFGPADWALYFIGAYGYIDGAHHKQWVLTQVVKILLGAPVTVKLARWDDGTQEYRASVGDDHPAYLAWAKSDDDDYEDWDEGVAP